MLQKKLFLVPFDFFRNQEYKQMYIHVLKLKNCVYCNVLGYSPFILYDVFCIYLVKLSSFTIVVNLILLALNQGFYFKVI
jgi:hypothetical protein